MSSSTTTSKSKDGTTDLTEQTQAVLETTESIIDKMEDHVEYYWDYVCDMLEDEEYMPHFIQWISKNILRRITVETPVILLFCFVCVCVHILQQTLFPDLNRFLAIQDKWDLSNNPMQIPNLFTHVIAHDGSLDHIKGNMIHILLVGPSAEHVYGSATMLLVIGLVALTSALAHIAVGSNYTHQLGASGVVFAVILLNSLVAAVSGTIPLSFLLTASIYCAEELYLFFWGTDATSHHAHLTGAIVGTVMAYYIRGINKSQLKSKPTSSTSKPKSPSTPSSSTSSGGGTARLSTNQKPITPLQQWFRNQMTSIKTKVN